MPPLGLSNLASVGSTLSSVPKPRPRLKLSRSRRVGRANAIGIEPAQMIACNTCAIFHPRIARGSPRLPIQTGIAITDGGPRRRPQTQTRSPLHHDVLALSLLDRSPPTSAIPGKSRY